MNDSEIARMRGWVGQTEERHDIVTPRLVAQFCATFDRPVVATPLPPSLHWCLAPAMPMAAELGEDGHARPGGFLPPVPLPRRMWAGGEVEFLAPLRMHDQISRRSCVMDVSNKTGRSGPLVFVTIRHEIRAPGGLAVRERQDLVYRAAQDVAAPPPPPAPPIAEHSREMTADAVLLFRYSALTFNGHRIHYDKEHCARNGYAGLVVHAPLQATAMLEMAARLIGRTPARFRYRALAPLFGSLPFSVNAREADAGLDLWIADASGCMTMQASAA